jgi:hypothetical protein
VSKMQEVNGAIAKQAAKDWTTIDRAMGPAPS